MSSIHRKAGRRRAGAVLAGSALLAAGLVPASATAQPDAASTTAASSAGAAGVTVRPDPSYAGEPFEGWGTSLVWFANATGGYPDEIRNQLADMLFGDDGMNLNIARYNIGGGNAPDVPDYLRAGADVDGWWRAPDGTTREDVDWWDPANPDHWNPDADATQRWWVDRIKSDITHWETFSNSPPWFQTVSGYVSGGFNSSADQLKTESIDEYAAYVVGATERLEDAHGIDVDTIDPFNEPNTNYWGTQLGADGNPTGGRQEGAHMGPGLQQQVIPALADAIDGSTTDAVISAMDETNPGRFATNWNAYPAAVRDQVSQLNVHTYGTGQRTTVRDIAKGEDKPLWMSEVGGSWSSTGQDFESMESGLGSAHHIVDDLRELEPSAWVFWQPVEDYDNMAPGGESPEGGNWGEIQIPFSCTAQDTLETCPIYTNTKYWVTQNFTHYITPGDRLIGVDDTDSTAAVSASGSAATVVHVNDTTADRDVTLDLSGFGNVAAGATVTPVVTSVDGYLVEGAPVAVQDAAATLTVPAESVTTFVVDGVSGVADDAVLAQDGHVYRLDGVQSDHSLAPSGDRVVIRTDAATADQLWALTPLGAPEGSGTHRTQYLVTSAADGRAVTVVSDGSVVLAPAPASPQDAPSGARWILSTTGDGTYTLVSAATGRLLEVGGESRADGASVGTWLANSNSNQRWRVVDETVLGTEPVDVFTVPGTAPVLPETVTPVYPGGPRGALPVTWDVPGDDAWAQAGIVEVTGTVAIPAGGTVEATATVVVDTLDRTLPAEGAAYVGGTAELPDTVTAVASGGALVERPVTWDSVPDGAFDELGVVELAGAADAGDGTTLPATVRVLVTKPGEANSALAAGATASATYTEPGYPVERVINGDLDDKGWSNWRPDAKNVEDTLTVTLPVERDVTRVVTHFWRDGSHLSWATAVALEARVDGAWQAVGDPVAVTSDGAAPVVDIPADVRADAVRVVLTARENTHMIVSEIEVMTKVPGEPSPVWDASVTYSAGDQVFHDGAYYRAIRTTQTEPGTSDHGPWEEIVRSGDGTPVWTASRIFVKGEVVVHEGDRYQAIRTIRGEEPGTSGSWRVVA